MRVVATAVQSIPNGSSTPTRFDQIEADAGLDSTGMWSSSNPTKVVIPVDGVYSITATFSYATSPDANKSRINRLMLNNVAFREWSNGSVTAYYVTSCSHTGFLAAGTVVTIDHYQGTTGALNTHTQDFPSLEVVLL